MSGSKNQLNIFVSLLLNLYLLDLFFDKYHMQKDSYLRYAACVTTGVSGIIHLSLVHPLHGPLQNMGIFFLVSGILQLFWIIPVARNWHMTWFYTGIGGTTILIVVWVLSRASTLITSRPFPVNQMGIIEESLQIAFIALLVAIIVYKSKTKQFNSKIEVEDDHQWIKNTLSLLE